MQLHLKKSGQSFIITCTGENGKMHLTPGYFRLQFDDQLCGSHICCHMSWKLKRGAELLTDQHLVVSWLRWWEGCWSDLANPNEWIFWDSLAESPLRKNFNSNIRESFNPVPGEVGNIASSIAEVADQCFCIDAYCSISTGSHWWTPMWEMLSGQGKDPAMVEA